MRKKRTDIPLILNAIIGNPVSHSMSPYLYTPLYRSLGIPAVLLPFGGPDVSTLVAAARVLHVHLMAVTMPFKRGVMAYLDRSVRKAAELKREFGGRLVTERELTHRSVDIIVNATLVGMRPRVAAMPVHARLIARHQCMFDLVYNPLQTALLKHAKRKGARTVSGIDMFVVQGLRQVEIWTGKKLVTSKLVERFKRALVSNRKLS